MVRSIVLFLDMKIKPHFDKNMQPLEEGILPDIAIDMTEDDQSKHRDTLIEKAFEILSE